MSENGAPTEKTRRTVGPVSFSRNVRWFIAALTGFLIFIILFLLLQLQTAMAEVGAASHRQQQAIALAAQRSVEAVSEPSPDRLRRVLDSIRAQSGTVAVELESGRGTIRSGLAGPGLAVVEQRSSHGRLLLYFDSSPFDEARRRFFWIAGLVIAATIGSLVLLLVLLPRITRPIDTMLRDSALLGERASATTDERFLVETFRSSIETLKRQETELRRLHESERIRADDLDLLTNLLTRNLSSGFIAIDREGNVTRINRAGQEILDVSPTDGPRPLKNVLGDTALARTLERSHLEQLPLTRHEMLLPSGITIGLTTVPVRSETGESLGMLALFSDLSEVKRLESRMHDIQALASLGEISAGIAHELRNSLSTLLGYLRLARRGSEEDRERRIVEAESEGTRISDTVASLLRFARPIEPEMEEVRLDEIVRNVVDRLEVEIPVEIEAAEVSVRGDRVLIASAIENIVRNAAEAVESTDSPLVRVKVVRDPVPSVQIDDNGPGIDPEFLPRIFLPFATSKPAGTGMGLALTRKILLHHQGDVRVEARPEGGTSVLMEFPLHFGG
ncbi:MAG: hypothetical protein KY459_09940 [Acidobacteria bacterium]|nr:hypothetical protein [Acidobacteriota bacterium]